MSTFHEFATSGTSSSATRSSGCYSGHEVSVTVCSLALGLFVSTVWNGYLFQGSPLSALGQRPLGRGLWSYLLEYYRKGEAVWGYDPILGAFSPNLRLRFHGVAILVVYALVVSVVGPHVPVRMDAPCAKKDLWSVMDLVRAGVVTVFVYGSWQYILHHLLPAVSHPGPARAHKMQRNPQWKDADSQLPDFCIEHWRCVVADESHAVSRHRFQATHAELTGEPSGRQIWTHHQPSSSTRKKAQEDLIQQLAAGGRTEKPGTFNPVKNPNR
jgi:hypothetical protein